MQGGQETHSSCGQPQSGGERVGSGDDGDVDTVGAEGGNGVGEDAVPREQHNLFVARGYSFVLQDCEEFEIGTIQSVSD